MTFSAGVGGGSSSIASSTDVALNNPLNNDNLAYNSTISKWVNSVDTGGSISTHDSLPLSVPGTVTYTGTSWPARTTVTTQINRRVFYIGNPGGASPADMENNDIWVQG